jgi:recombination protein RecT
MSNALTLITGEINAIKDDFMTLLSDRSIKFEQEAGFAVQILGGNDFALKTAVANRQSVVNAVKNIAAIGISLNPAKKQAYLVPRKVGGQVAICLDISYMGLMDLAMATGSIKWAQAELVRANDGFARGRFDEPPTHTFNPFSKDRGDIVGVYVVVKTADGDYLTHTMEIGDVYDIRDRSEAWKAYVAQKIFSCPWVTDTGEMIKKTCVKQAYKYWPKTERLETAIHHLNTDGGEGLRDINERPEGLIDVNPIIAAALKTKTDAAALAFWRENNAALIKQPGDHKKLKDIIAGHRAKMADALRTIEMPKAEPTEPQPMTDAEIEAADLARTVEA